MKKEIMKFLLGGLVTKVFLIGIVVLAASCSSDDNDDPQPQPEVLDLDTEPAKDYDGLSVQLQLLNSDSVALKTFKEGEDIIFKLTITNNRTKVASIPALELLAEDIFHIYSADGKDLGKPWDDYITGGAGILPVYMERPQIIDCRLDGNVEPFNLDEFNEAMWQTVHLRKRNLYEKLPKGSYYTKFDMPFEKGQVITFKKEFKVI